MKQLIIAIYDSWYYGEVYSKGKRNHNMETLIKKAYTTISKHYWWEEHNKNDLTFNKWVLNRYDPFYESIIICENGGIEVLK